MHPLGNTTGFLVVVGARHIPEGHLDDCRGEARRRSFGTTDPVQACPQATQAMTWWPRTCH